MSGSSFILARPDLKDLLVSDTVNSKKGMPKNLVFTESLRNICMLRFGIREADVRDALEAPDKEQPHQVDDLTLGFYIKRHQRNGIEAYLLVCTEKTEEREIVHQAFWAFPDLTGGLNVLEPFILLQQLVRRFGLALRVGNQLNNFIFRETITLRGPVTAGPVVEIINPEHNDCIQSFFIKIIEDGSSYHIHCALAFCIDVKSYTRWLTGARSIQGIDFQIAPQLQGHVTLQSLIVAEGTLEFQMSYTKLGEGTLFRIKSTDYYLAVGFTPTHFYISRNDDTLERILQRVYMPTGKAHFFAIWAPRILQLIVLDEIFTFLLALG